MTDILEMGKSAQQASYQLATLPTAAKHQLIAAIAAKLEQSLEAILQANQADIQQGQADGLSEALLDRLLLDEPRLAAIIADMHKVIALPDPVGCEFDGRELENGLSLKKRRVPIGVIGVIFEARPNVTIDVATLCLKTGNAVILRGGKETLRTNRVLVGIIRTTASEQGLDANIVQFIDDPERALVTQLLKLDQYVDMIIPRGGQGLHQLCKEQSTIPVITGGIGICHIYIDASANKKKAIDIVENAKVQRPSVCNALDTLLIHSGVASDVLPDIAQRLLESGVKFKAEPRAYALLSQVKGVELEHDGEGDFDTEWLSLTLSVKLVDSLDEAILHIRQHSTQHSDAILTQSLLHAERFVNEVNSAAVYVNSSTRFTDGSQFGLGAEVAVSTQKLHARGPMGLEALTTYKWVGSGDNLIRG